MPGLDLTAGNPADPAFGAVATVPGVIPWRMVSVLALFATFAAIDKNILSLVVPDIKADFGVTDVQIGVLIGLAFAVSNVAISVPAGWLADRGNRRVIVAAGVLLWSTLAVTCGFAKSYGQLFLARIGVGLGEGISPPASYSLIRDGVPTGRRGFAYAVFSVGGAVGSGLAFLVGGSLIAFIRGLDLTGVPLVGAMPAWQVALVAIGLAGFPLALLAFAFPDPGRPVAAGAALLTVSERPTLAQSAHAAGRHWRLLVPLLVFSVVQSMLTAGLSAWVPALLQRTFAIDAAHFGPMLGLVLIVGAPTGLIGAGLLMDRLGRDGPAIAAVCASLLVMVAGGLAPHVPSIDYYWPFQAIIIMASTVYLPVTSTLVARIMPSATIGVVMAGFLLVQGIVGAGLGPIVVAVLTEHMFSATSHPINAAITAASLCLGGVTLASAVVLLIGSRRIEGDPR